MWVEADPRGDVDETKAVDRRRRDAQSQAFLAATEQRRGRVDVDVDVDVEDAWSLGRSRSGAAGITKVQYRPNVYVRARALC